MAEACRVLEAGLGCESWHGGKRGFELTEHVSSFSRSRDGFEGSMAIHDTGPRDDKGRREERASVRLQIPQASEAEMQKDAGRRGSGAQRRAAPCTAASMEVGRKVGSPVTAACSPLTWRRGATEEGALPLSRKRPVGELSEVR
jgi:hypothetical protein